MEPLCAVAVPGSGGFRAVLEQTSVGYQGFLVSSGLALSDSGTAAALGLLLGENGK